MPEGHFSLLVYTAEDKAVVLGSDRLVRLTWWPIAQVVEGEGLSVQQSFFLDNKHQPSEPPRWPRRIRRTIKSRVSIF